MRYNKNADSLRQLNGTPGRHWFLLYREIYRIFMLLLLWMKKIILIIHLMDHYICRAPII